MSKRAVFFGGTFDPVHNGHLSIARAVARSLDLPRITLVPALVPPHKEPASASAADRLAMLRLAAAGDALFEVSEIELARRGPSYTYDTLQALRRQVGGPIGWIIGADMLPLLPKWHRAAELLREVEFIVVGRRPWQGQIETIRDLLRKSLGPAVAEAAALTTVAAEMIDISSSDIRARLARGEPIAALVPPAVEKYIREHGLYRRTKAL